MKRMRIARLLAIVAVPTLLIVATVATVSAITNGVPDGEDHPYVGLAVFHDADGNPLWRCSGTLVDSTHFLTAGHCTEPPAAHAAIWFESDVQSGIPGNGYPYGGGTSSEGTPYTHPQYDPNRFYLHDLGVVVLDNPKEMDEYGRLPTLGQLDALATKRGLQDVTFTAVGYGLQDVKPVVEAMRVRMQAALHLVDLRGTAGIPRGTAVILSGDAHTGGTCFGDSGGPLFLNDSTVVAAVTSFGLNSTCGGVGGGYRLDQADDLEWLATFGLEP